MVFGVAGNHDGTQMWYSKSKVVFGTVKRRGQGRVSSAVIVLRLRSLKLPLPPARAGTLQLACLRLAMPLAGG